MIGILKDLNISILTYTPHRGSEKTGKGKAQLPEHFPNVSHILRKLPKNEAFYFFTSIGNYTGTVATSLKEFLDKIREVEVKSLEFHLYRGDFEKWVAEIIGDKELAEQIRKLKDQNLTGENLRNQLHLIISKRCEMQVFSRKMLHN